MLFAHAFDSPNLLGWIRRFRKNTFRVYGSALLLVLSATLIRLGLHQELSSASPFTLYSLPILCVALAGGFYPGMVTLAASVLTGSILFLPPAFSFTLAEGAEWPLLIFVVVGIIQVILVSGLIAAILLHDTHQHFLFGELRHRSRNLFAVVQGIVSRTLMESPTLADARQSLDLRLASLARTHAMMADSGWMGAPLDQIISEELTSFANQVSCNGCALPLNTPAGRFAEDVDVQYRPEGMVYKLKVSLAAIQTAADGKSVPRPATGFTTSLLPKTVRHSFSYPHE
jgi:two-component sensor histidine kinase